MQKSWIGCLPPMRYILVVVFIFLIMEFLSRRHTTKRFFKVSYLEKNLQDWKDWDCEHLTVKSTKPPFLNWFHKNLTWIDSNLIEIPLIVSHGLAESRGWCLVCCGRKKKTGADRKNLKRDVMRLDLKENKNRSQSL